MAEAVRGEMSSGEDVRQSWYRVTLVAMCRDGFAGGGRGSKQGSGSGGGSGIGKSWDWEGGDEGSGGLVRLVGCEDWGSCIVDPGFLGSGSRTCVLSGGGLVVDIVFSRKSIYC